MLQLLSARCPRRWNREASAKNNLPEKWSVTDIIDNEALRTKYLRWASLPPLSIHTVQGSTTTEQCPSIVIDLAYVYSWTWRLFSAPSSASRLDPNPTTSIDLASTQAEQKMKQRSCKDDCQPASLPLYVGWCDFSAALLRPLNFCLDRRRLRCIQTKCTT